MASIVVFLRTLAAGEERGRELTQIKFPVVGVHREVRWPQPLTRTCRKPNRRSPVARGKHLAEIVSAAVNATRRPTSASRCPEWRSPAARSSPSARVRYRSANITPHASGLAHYDEALFLKTMRTGNIGGRPLSPVMPFEFFKNITDDDARDIYA